MKPLAKVKIWFDRDPEIHPEDAANAIRAWFSRAHKGRHKPPQVILEKALIASAMNDKDGKQVRPPIWRYNGKRLPMPDDGFETRWKRAQKDGRAPMFDAIDIVILRSWRKIRWPDLAKQGCPGLREWSPRAATALLRTRPEINAEKIEKIGDEIWYDQKRRRLGLMGKLRYRVRDFRRYQDGHCEIEID